MGKLIFPPNYEELTGPTIFLAGPIQGALPWQEDAIEYLRRKDFGFNIACPRRREKIDKKSFTIEQYNEQVDWETFHLKRAGFDGGAVLFWLANEHEHLCRRAYAQTTRFELAEWKMKHQLQGARVVVGIDTNFSNAKYIRKRIAEDTPGIPLCSTLEETCKEALKLVRESI